MPITSSPSPAMSTITSSPSPAMSTITSSPSTAMTPTSFRASIRPTVSTIAEDQEQWEMCPLFVSLAQMLLIAAPVDENVEWKFGNMWYNNLSFIISSLDVKDMEYYIKTALSIDCSSMKLQDAILWYYYLGRLTSFADELSYLVGLLNYYVGKVFSHGFDFVAAEKVVNLLRRVMTTEHIMWDTYKYHIKDRLENGVSEFHPESI